MHLLAPALLLPLALSSPLHQSRAPPQSGFGSDHAGGISNTTLATIQSILDRWTITGAVVAYVSPGKDEVLGLGKRDVRGNNVTDETYFAIASNTKLFTAMAISMMMEDQVKLPNGQPLQPTSLMKDIVPGWTMKNATIGESVTLLDVMSMTSGLPQHILATTPLDTPLTAISRTPNLTLTLPSGQNATLQYSNHNYEILGGLPSLLLNQSVETYVQDRIFTPLGMGATRNATYAGTKERSMGFLRSAPNATKCAEVLGRGGEYSDVSCMGRPEAFEFWTNGTSAGFYGGAGINLRGVDMIKWANELISPSHLPSTISTRLQTIVSAPNTDSPLNSTATIEFIAYQAGLISLWYRGHKFYYHDGALPGANSYFIWSPTAKVATFIAANDDLITPYANVIIARTVLDDLLGLPAIDWEKEIIGNLLGTSSASGATSGDSTSGTGTAPTTAAEGNSTTPANSSTSATRPPPTGYFNSTFSSSTYGNFTLHPLNFSSPANYTSASLPAEWLLIQGAAAGLNLTGQGYYATYSHSILSHFVFSHVDGPLYNYTGLFVRPRLDTNGDADGLTAKVYAVGPAVFAEGGIGMFGNIALKAASVPDAKVVEVGVEQAAPVWFGQVKGGAGNGTQTTVVDQPVQTGGVGRRWAEKGGVLGMAAMVGLITACSQGWA